MTPGQYESTSTGRSLPPVATWVPMVFVAAFAAQAGHVMLHVAQLFQDKVYHIYPKTGLLGPALVNNEWLHFGEVTAFWFMMMTVWFAYGKERRAVWKQRSLSGYRAGVTLLFVSFYHMVEHWVKIVQHVKTGITPAPGIIGHWVDLVWFHAIINSVEMLLICIFAASTLIDRDIPFMERQRTAMARAAGRRDFTTAGWRFAGYAVCVAPLLVLFSDEVGPVPAPSASLTVQRLAIAHDGFSLASFVGLVGAALLIPAAAGLLRLGGKPSRLLQAGAGLVFVGAIGLVALMGLFLLASEAGQLSVHGSKHAYVILAETVLKPHGYLLIMWAMTVMLAPGFVLLALGLYARKAIPLWSALCIGVGITGQVWGHLATDLVGLWSAGNLIWVVGMFPVGLGIIREVRRAQSDEPVISSALGRPDIAAGTA
jgi:hypothetical protein